ncbi:hypothetical protein Glove_97g61 [Diversispora epigaea]|uniref:Tc1-like transposase DDE domain-containing protein n=1 Tax=Diversispora epigaea TaxID=1348612 RepID=A0A397J4R4_9GLOM|nr:hypothetical protein Glove_97g61 [Diversispora epigaea]
MERDPTTICRFIAKYKKTENLPRSGRPPTLNNDEKDALVNEATKKRRASLHEIINNLGLNCKQLLKKHYDAEIHSHIAAKSHLFQKIMKQTHYGRCSVMVWGCFVGEIKGPLPHLLPFYNAAHELIGEKLVFQHDNSPIHTAKKNRKMTALREEWSKFDVSIFRKVVDSMPQRIEAALNAKGGPTKKKERYDKREKNIRDIYTTSRVFSKPTIACANLYIRSQLSLILPSLRSRHGMEATFETAF